MSRELADAQTRLIADLRDGRVPAGFDVKGVRATTAVLERKRHRDARASTPRLLWVRLRSLLAWLRNDP